VVFPVPPFPANAIRNAMVYYTGKIY